jgi:PAS domain S-box-containing protein
MTPPTQLDQQTLNDAHYRQMVNTITDYAIFFLDLNGLVISWNPGAKRLKGYEAGEIMGRHISTFYPAELIEKRWPERELSVARSAGRVEDEGWRVRKDGTRFWANIILTRLDGADGAPIGFSKITRDLTERRRQEEELRHSEERFRLLVEGVHDYAIFMLDPSGFIVSWNRGAQHNKGYDGLGDHRQAFLGVLSARPEGARLARRRAAPGPARWPLRRRRLARAQGRHAFLGQRRDHRPERRHRHPPRLRQGDARPDRAPARARAGGRRPAHHQLPGHARP